LPAALWQGTLHDVAAIDETGLERTMMPTPKPAPASMAGAMTCGEAFRTIARQHLHRLTEQHRAACAGHVEAVHEMRIALTCLRTSIAFFSPMVEGADQVRISAELKWLNAHLGIVRDLDVAIGRLMKAGGRTADMKIWKQERAACQRHLTRALRSQRYRRLIRDTSAWIEKGAWSAKRGQKAAGRRLRPVDEYSAEKLTQWRNKLLKKSGKLEEVGVRKRHRVRLINKRLSYALEAIASLVPDDAGFAGQAALKQLRKAQKSLGQLNDDARYRSLADGLFDGKVSAPELLGPKRKKRLLHKAADAYREFGKLEPFRAPKTSTPDGRVKATERKRD
jgi:CHAD domain-containing protein